MLKILKRYWPLLFLIILAAIFYFSGLARFLSFDTLKTEHHVLKHLVLRHPVASPLVFMSIYILSVALCFPTSFILSLFGGFLFPQPFSTIYVVIAATLGAAILFLAAHGAFEDYFRRQAGPRLYNMKRGFEENATSYMLFLRLIHIFPFWIVNLIPVFFRVPFKIFLWTTFIGVIPGSFVDTQAGRGLDILFENNEAFSLIALFNTQFKIALICLGLFALIPVFIKTMKKRR